MGNRKIKLKADAGRKFAPLGEPLNWTPLDIEIHAQVTEEDKLSALAFWDVNAPANRKGLLRAKPRKRKRQ